MRQRAKQAGNLQTTPQEKVSTKGQTIVIQPAAPDVVYVPQYDPWLVYGYPLAVFPGWYPYPGLFLDGPGIAFGLGFGVGLFAGFGWGWHGWGYDWHHGGRVEFNHNTYISHSRTIVNRNSFNSGRANFNHAADSHGRSFGGHEGFHGRKPHIFRRNAFRRLQRVRSWRECKSQFLPRAVQLWRLPRRRLRRWRFPRGRRLPRRRGPQIVREVIRP